MSTWTQRSQAVSMTQANARFRPEGQALADGVRGSGYGLATGHFGPRPDPHFVATGTRQVDPDCVQAASSASAGGAAAGTRARRTPALAITSRPFNMYQALRA